MFLCFLVFLCFHIYFVFFVYFVFCSLGMFFASGLSPQVAFLRSAPGRAAGTLAEARARTPGAAHCAVDALGRRLKRAIEQEQGHHERVFGFQRNTPPKKKLRTRTPEKK